VTYDTGPAYYSITTYGTVHGNIQLDPAQDEYPEDSSVTVTAVPATGYMLETWLGDLSGKINPQSVLMDGDKVIEASFVPDNTVPDVFENFDYVQDADLTGQSGGHGWSGDWFSITGNDWHADATGLVHPQAISPGGKATYRKGGKAGRVLATPLGNNNGSTVYLSFLMRAAGTDTSTSYSAVNLLQGGNTDSHRQFEIGILADGSGQFTAGDRSRNTTAPLGAVDTATHLVVMEFTFNTGTLNDEIKVWLNPSAYSDPPVTLTGIDVSFDRIVLSSWIQDITFDEIRIAGNWEAVTGADAPQSPPLSREELLVHALGADSAETLPDHMPDLNPGSGPGMTYLIPDTQAEDIGYEIELSEDLTQWYRIARKPKYGIWSKDSESAYPGISEVFLTPAGSGISLSHSPDSDLLFLRLKLRE
jgi:hypothetical protein